MPLTAMNTDMPYAILDTNQLLYTNPSEYILTVKDLPDEDKPREKLGRVGSKNLSLAELIAVLLGTGTRREEVLGMSQRIIREYGEKALQQESNPRKLAASLDIPLSKACQIVAAFELGRRFYAQKAGKPVFIRNAHQAYEHLQGMSYSPKEQMRGLYLNSRRELIHDEVLSVGTLTANVVHPREVFQPAIIHGAVAVIIAHNHPSGDPTPTPPDRAVTDQLMAAGELLGISLLDHLVITENSFKSII